MHHKRQGNPTTAVKLQARRRARRVPFLRFALAAPILLAGCSTIPKESTTVAEGRMPYTTQVVIGKLKSVEHRDQFIELTKEMVSWLNRQQGFVDYAFYEDGINISDTLTYESDEEAKRINEDFPNRNNSPNVFGCLTDCLLSDIRKTALEPPMRPSRPRTKKM